ncbi:MAG TPA: hypothetical protein VFT74_09970, partial [Isosphaeraceae bacterium]|nr:hypothetical protein [Isosphaeraceae bacterium]
MFSHTIPGQLARLFAALGVFLPQALGTPHGPGHGHGSHHGSMYPPGQIGIGPGFFVTPPVYGLMIASPPPPPVPLYVGPPVPVPNPLSVDPMHQGPTSIDPSIDPSAPGPQRPDHPARPVLINNPRALERLTVGDRLFRVGERVKATRRYQQALEADPTLAAGYVRLAQVALARGRYHEAADHFREAQTAEPGWLAFPDDVQNLFGDPADFASVL